MEPCGRMEHSVLSGNHAFLPERKKHENRKI